MRRLILPLLLAWAGSAAAQSIDPGMSKAQVIERLGKPGVERSKGTFTYLYYVNGRERQVGMNDLVILDNDAVVDAIFRAPGRHYNGASSSPDGVRPEKSLTSGEQLAIPAPAPAAPPAQATPNAPPPGDTPKRDQPPAAEPPGSP